jgi:hypothetical protein
LSQLNKLNINQRLDTNRQISETKGIALSIGKLVWIVFLRQNQRLATSQSKRETDRRKDNALQLGLFDILTKRKPLEF